LFATKQSSQRDRLGEMIQEDMKRLLNDQPDVEKMKLLNRRLNTVVIGGFALVLFLIIAMFLIHFSGEILLPMDAKIVDLITRVLSALYWPALLVSSAAVALRVLLWGMDSFTAANKTDDEAM
jgi:hypothetical protein